MADTVYFMLVVSDRGIRIHRSHFLEEYVHTMHLRSLYGHWHNIIYNQPEIKSCLSKLFSNNV